jgi:hypothetical protein
MSSNSSKEKPVVVTGEDIESEDEADHHHHHKVKVHNNNRKDAPHSEGDGKSHVELKSQQKGHKTRQPHQVKVVTFGEEPEEDDDEEDVAEEGFVLHKKSFNWVCIRDMENSGILILFAF